MTLRRVARGQPGAPASSRTMDPAGAKGVDNRSLLAQSRSMRHSPNNASKRKISVFILYFLLIDSYDTCRSKGVRRREEFGNERNTR